MLQKISDRIQGWVAGIIIAIIALVFGLWGIEYYINQGGNDSPPVATVNGHKISEKSLNSLYRQLLQRVAAAQPNKTLTIGQQNEVKSLALQQLISKMALVDAAKKTGFGVSKEQVQAIIMEAPEFQVKGFFSPQRFQQFLFAIQSTEAQFIKQLQGNFIMNQVSVGLETSAFLLPNELRRAYELIYQKRSFGYFVLPLSKFLSHVKVADKEIQSYYEKNKNVYRTPEKVQVNYLVLSPKAIEKNIAISAAELKSYYEGNKSSYTTSKQWKIKQIIVPVPKSATETQITNAEEHLKKIQMQLESGKSFSAVMKEPGLQSAEKTITPASADASIKAVLAKLSEGQISQPFHTTNGVAIIKLISIVPGKVKSFSDVKNQIADRLKRQKAQQILSQKSDTLSNLTYTNPSTLVVAAKKLGLSVQTSPLFDKQGLKNGLFAIHSVVTAAFSNDVLQEGNNSNVIDLKDGSVMVLRVKKHKPSIIQPLSVVKATIVKVIAKNKAESKAGLEAYTISSALGEGTSPQALAKRYGLTWLLKTSVKRNDKTTPRPILISAFATIPTDGKTHPGTNTLVMANGNYIVLKVTSVQLADFVEAQTKPLAALKKQLTRLNGEMEYRLYGKSVIGRAKIKLHQQKDTNIS